jgi:hypothetical protein
MTNNNNQKIPTHCKVCKKQFPRNRLIYALCYEDWLCVDCYKAQFERTPMKPKPIYIKPWYQRKKCI